MPPYSHIQCPTGNEEAEDLVPIQTKLKEKTRIRELSDSPYSWVEKEERFLNLFEHNLFCHLVLVLNG